MRAFFPAGAAPASFAAPESWGATAGAVELDEEQPGTLATAATNTTTKKTILITNIPRAIERGRKKKAPRH